jgi:hypothetical protein
MGFQAGNGRRRFWLADKSATPQELHRATHAHRVRWILHIRRPQTVSPIVKSIHQKQIRVAAHRAPLDVYVRTAVELHMFFQPPAPVEIRMLLT